jgi:cell division protein FtsL
METSIAIICGLMVLAFFAAAIYGVSSDTKITDLQYKIKQLEYEVERRINP